MFLSIIIPVHNTEKYIRDCLDSCLSQDIDINEYEIICVDDFSTDNSVCILREYQKRTSNLTVICLSKNKGVSAARNAGIERMRGDYCMFLDSDDYLEDNCLSHLKLMLSAAEKKTILCIGQYHFQENGATDRHMNKLNGEYFGCPMERYVTNRLIPSELVAQLRFQENIAYGEDEVFCLELDLFKPHYLKLDEPLYYYRRHNESAMAISPEKGIKQFESVVNAAAYIKDKYGFGFGNTKEFYRERIQIAFSFISKQKNGKKREYLHLMKERGLLFPFKHCEAGYDIYVAYFIFQLKRADGRIRSLLVRKFPIILQLKKVLKH